MRLAFWRRLAIVTILGLGSISPATAAQFEQQEIDQSRFIVLAAPGGDIGYKLLILEQLNDKRPCWSETGSNPSNVEPLLLSFDFTGICNRIVDSNGFSLRTAGQDQALDYSLRIIPDGNDLVLVADANADRDTIIEIGRTYGMPTGFSRIVLNPGWRLTRRAFNGRPVGHIYLTYDQPIESLIASSRRNLGMGGDMPTPIPAPALEPLPSASPSETESVIPVPSLPPAAVEPPALPPRNPQSVPTPNSAPNSDSPSLSSILPPPPPIETPTDRAAPINTPPLTEPPATESSNLDGSSTRSSAPAQRTTQPASRTSITPTPSRVPATSTSGGALLRPRSQRQSATAARQRPTNSVSRGNGTSQAENSQVESSTANGSSASTSASNEIALANAETYQVVVVADDAEVQDKVRAISPSAILTTINGQVVMQVGLFRDRQEADRLQQRLSLEGLPTAVIPVR